MSRKREIIFMTVTVVICVLLFSVKLTGTAVHAVLGLCMLVAVIKHTCRRIAGMQHKTKAIKNVDKILLGAMALLLLSGLLAHFTGSPAVLKVMHALLGVIFFIGLLTHIIQQKQIGKAAEEIVS